MAKIALTKLGLKPNTEIKTIEWNEQSVEVKQYLPIEAKLDLISDIANKSLDDNPYYNPARIKIFIKLEIILAYTNINVTEKQREDNYKLYDIFSNGLGEQVLNAIPNSEYDFIKDTTWEIIKGVYQYKNSAVGIINTIAQDYDSTKLNLEALQQTITDPNMLAFLKEFIPFNNNL